MKFVDVLQENIRQIKLYDGIEEVDFNEIIYLWHVTSQFRKKKLIRERSQDIMKDWPVLQHPQGYKLVFFLFYSYFFGLLKNFRFIDRDRFSNEFWRCSEEQAIYVRCMESNFPKIKTNIWRDE